MPPSELVTLISRVRRVHEFITWRTSGSKGLENLRLVAGLRHQDWALNAISMLGHPTSKPVALPQQYTKVLKPAPSSVLPPASSMGLPPAPSSSGLASDYPVATSSATDKDSTPTSAQKDPRQKPKKSKGDVEGPTASSETRNGPPI
jgi:hypothetical protein